MGFVSREPSVTVPRNYQTPITDANCSRSCWCMSLGLLGAGVLHCCMLGCSSSTQELGKSEKALEASQCLNDLGCSLALGQQPATLSSSSSTTTITTTTTLGLVQSPTHTSHSKRITIQVSRELSLENLKSQPEDRGGGVEIQSSPGRKPWLGSDMQ